MLRLRLTGERRFQRLTHRKGKQPEGPAIVALFDARPGQNIGSGLAHGTTLMFVQPLLLAALCLRVPQFAERCSEQSVRCGVVRILAHGLLQVLGRLPVVVHVPKARAQVEGEVGVRRVSLVSLLEVGQSFRVAPAASLHDSQITRNLTQRNLLRQ